MTLEHRIQRWCHEAERRGIQLERILIHSDDLAEALALFPWLPVKVIGFSSQQARY